MWHRAREMPPKQRHGSPCRPRRAESPRSSGRPRPASTVQTPVSARLEAKPPGTSPACPLPRVARGIPRARESTHRLGLAVPGKAGHAVHSTAHWWQCHAAMVVSALRPGGPAHRQTRALRLVACLLRDRAELPEAAPRCQIITPQSW